jgi:hypothetical protein
MFTFPAYILKNNGVAISTAITVQQLKAGTNGPIAILRHSLTQDGSVTSTQIRASFLRKSAAATVTTAVAGTTLLKQNPVAPTTDASLGTSATGITATVEGTDGELTYGRGFNVLNGQEAVYTPEERIIVPQGGIIAQKLPTAFNSTWNAEIAFMELRGG